MVLFWRCCLKTSPLSKWPALIECFLPVEPVPQELIHQPIPARRSAGRAKWINVKDVLLITKELFVSAYYYYHYFSISYSFAIFR
jgi:hypothetical protein